MMDIQFLGAAGEVTGSCHWVRCQDHAVLLDCGLLRGRPRTEIRNREPFPFDPARLDAVVLSHAHLDHSGRLPLLFKQGFRGRIYAQRATADLCRIMLRDAGYLNEKDAEWENRKRQRKHLPPVEPLYTQRDAERVMRCFSPVGYDESFDAAPGIRVRLRDAGHILGSSIVELSLQAKGVRRKVVFSGDLGHRDAPILRDPQAVQEADLVLLEATYGDRLHRPWEATWQEVAGVFRDAAAERGNILIPAFAVGRTQELLYVFKEHFAAWGLDRWQVFLDSPLAIEATEVYGRHWREYDREAQAAHARGGDPFALPNLHISRTSAQSAALNRISSGAIIIAGSGMCEGGRIRHHLKHNVWRQGTHVLIIGFQAAGTLGRQLVEGARNIRLWGETIRVAARVHTIGGLSAHADQAGLLDWCRQIQGKPTVALVHGEPAARDALAEQLQQRFGRRVLKPALGERLDLAALPSAAR
jgi:metallo-beta-lactamase family protein